MWTTRSLRRSPISGPDAGAAAPPLDALSSAPRACYSVRRRLLTSYTGPLVRVRKTTGGDTTTEHDVPYAVNGTLDAADLAAFVGSESWAIVTVYDQTAGARHITQATVANQPLGGTAGVGVTLATFPAADLDGTDNWTRGDALGLSGAVALTLWLDCSFDAVLGNVPISIGGTGAGQLFSFFDVSATLLRIGINGANRTFTASSITAGRQRLIARIGAGAGVGTAQMMQNGTELVESSSVNPANTVTLGTTATVLGAYVDGTAPHDGKIVEAAFWNADLSAGDLAIINGLS